MRYSIGDKFIVLNKYGSIRCGSYHDWLLEYEIKIGDIIEIIEMGSYSNEPIVLLHGTKIKTCILHSDFKKLINEKIMKIL